MSERMSELLWQAGGYTKLDGSYSLHESQLQKFAELILANADELQRMMNTDPINKPFELNPKFIAKCDELGRSRRQYQ